VAAESDQKPSSIFVHLKAALEKPENKSTKDQTLATLESMQEKIDHILPVTERDTESITSFTYRRSANTKSRPQKRKATDDSDSDDETTESVNLSKNRILFYELVKKLYTKSPFTYFSYTKLTKQLEPIFKANDLPAPSRTTVIRHLHEPEGVFIVSPEKSSISEKNIDNHSLYLSVGMVRFYVYRKNETGIARNSPFVESTILCGKFNEKTYFRVIDLIVRGEWSDRLPDRVASADLSDFQADIEKKSSGKITKIYLQSSFFPKAGNIGIQDDTEVYNPAIEFLIDEEDHIRSWCIKFLQNDPSWEDKKAPYAARARKIKAHFTSGIKAALTQRGAIFL